MAQACPERHRKPAVLSGIDYSRTVKEDGSQQSAEKKM
jgi:hypothetical protein